MAAGITEQGSHHTIPVMGLQFQGLSESEVIVRRAHGLGNTAPLKTSRSYIQIVRENVFMFVNTIMFILIVALLLLGQYSDAIVSMGVVSFNVLISLVQEIRAKRVLDRIALLTRPKATVMREGQERLVDPGEIVIDDILVVRPGDQMVVDGPMVSDGHLEVDESLLSGESDLIPKRLGDHLYSGSFCVSGSACYRAEQVGQESVANQITRGARAFRRIYTPLQRGINLIIQVTLLVALFCEILLVMGSALNHTPLVAGVRMTVVIVGIIPKGLLLATSVAYALGALRILGKGALVQQANAVESLSNVDVLCLDKTGTLTANTLVLDAMHRVGTDVSELQGLLADYVANLSVGNTTSAAIGAACGGQSAHILHIHEEVPFSSARKWSALAVDDAQQRAVYVLGAPEILQPALRSVTGLEEYIDTEAARGLRVVLFAFIPALVPLHDANGEPCLPKDLIPLGVVSLRDELRPEAQATLTSFAEAGIKLKIISGDHPQTVAALAKQAGLGSDIRCISGEEVAGKDAAQLAQVAEETTIFGRITPEQKAQLVQALHSRGHYVAMIGDGVNDVLSLKQANLGIAMQSGSSATRGVADIVLLKDSFAALPQVFREGQRIRNGMHTILQLFLTRIAYVAILIVATMVIDGFPFVPKQNAILTLVTEGIPTVALAAWAHPGQFGLRERLHSFFHFVLPAALTLSLAGLGVYLMALVSTTQAANPGTGNLAITPGALAIAQSALTTFAIVCGLLLIPFVVPPTRAWVGGNRLSGDWRPTLLALGLLLGYVVMLVIPPLRGFFELVSLRMSDYALIGAIAVAWGLILLWIWRARLLERFLQVHWE